MLRLYPAETPPTVTDAEVDALEEAGAIYALDVGEFYPSRDAAVRVECHTVAGGDRRFTVWAEGLPVAVNLIGACEAAAVEVEQRDRAGGKSRPGRI